VEETASLCMESLKLRRQREPGMLTHPGLKPPIQERKGGGFYENPFLPAIQVVIRSHGSEVAAPKEPLSFTQPRAVAAVRGCSYFDTKQYASAIALLSNP